MMRMIKMTFRNSFSSHLHQIIITVMAIIMLVMMITINHLSPVISTVLSRGPCLFDDDVFMVVVVVHYYSLQVGSVVLMVNPLQAIK